MIVVILRAGLGWVFAVLLYVGISPVSAGKMANKDHFTRHVLKWPVSGCERIENWYILQDAYERKEFRQILSTECVRLKPGTIILARPEKLRPSLYHRGHQYTQIVLLNGTKLWGDEFDDLALGTGRFAHSAYPKL